VIIVAAFRQKDLSTTFFWTGDGKTSRIELSIFNDTLPQSLWRLDEPVVVEE
jgi:hypothetical protein